MKSHVVIHKFLI